MPEMKRITLSITVEQERFLKLMELAVDVKKSQLVRDFLDDAISKNKNTIEKFLKTGAN